MHSRSMPKKVCLAWGEIVKDKNERRKEEIKISKIIRTIVRNLAFPHTFEAQFGYEKDVWNRENIQISL